LYSPVTGSNGIPWGAETGISFIYAFGRRPAASMFLIGDAFRGGRAGGMSSPPPTASRSALASRHRRTACPGSDSPATPSPPPPTAADSLAPPSLTAVAPATPPGCPLRRRAALPPPQSRRPPVLRPFDEVCPQSIALDVAGDLEKVSVILHREVLGRRNGETLLFAVKESDFLASI
jgi:hypothetical protein